MQEQSSLEAIEAQIADFYRNFTAVKKGISQQIVGHEDIIEFLLLAFFSGGHVLLEGLPGLGKTLLVQTLAECISVQYSRIQFTPDLMPADIIGTRVIRSLKDDQKGIEFEAGPLFAGIVLADEINRTTPKTQSALLQGMQEKKVTVANNTYDLPRPFMVVATQNPIEMEGTYPLPEAQLDRFFFKLQVSFPELEDLIKIAVLTTQSPSATIAGKTSVETVCAMQKLVPQVCIADHLLEYAGRIILATHPNTTCSCPLAQRYVLYGSSPRGIQSLILGAKALALYNQRAHVAREDIDRVAVPSLQHRLILNFEGEADGISPFKIIAEAIEKAKK